VVICLTCFPQVWRDKWAQEATSRYQFARPCLYEAGHGHSPEHHPARQGLGWPIKWEPTLDFWFARVGQGHTNEIQHLLLRYVAGRAAGTRGNRGAASQTKPSTEFRGAQTGVLFCAALATKFVKPLELKHLSLQLPLMATGLAAVGVTT